ncbi:glucokinase [Frateuria aurantia]
MSVFVVADVGGTHARLGITHAGQASGKVLESTIRRYVCADWSGLDAIVADYLQRTAMAAPASAFLCAIAGYLQDGEVINRNLPWPVSHRLLSEACGGMTVHLVNDFEALAYATLALDESELAPILRPAVTAKDSMGSTIVLGPGTGLGSAILIRGPAGLQVLPAEAGQMAMAPTTGRELKVFEQFARRHSYVATEHVLSGPGLLATYQMLCAFDGAAPNASSPAEVSELAHSNADPLAVEALDIFCGLLGSLAGDLAMLVGATGGIYLGGGFVPDLLKFLPRSSFERRFFNKGVMRRYLEQVPVWGLLPAEYGMRGAAVMAGLAMPSEN